MKDTISKVSNLLLTVRDADQESLELTKSVLNYL